MLQWNHLANLINDKKFVFTLKRLCLWNFWVYSWNLHIPSRKFRQKYQSAYFLNAGFTSGPARRRKILSVGKKYRWVLQSYIYINIYIRRISGINGQTWKQMLLSGGGGKVYGLGTKAYLYWSNEFFGKKRILNRLLFLTPIGFRT